MKRNKLPENRLDIVTPVLDEKVLPICCASLYPEFFELDMHADEKRGVQLHPVTTKASAQVRKATEIIGYYFRREFEYDFPPYDADEQEDERDRTFLLTMGDWDERDVIGAIGFRWREYSNAPHQLVLAWIWIHPFLRRKGIFTAYWEVFRKLYGDFHVEFPLSTAMYSFLKKMGALPVSKEEEVNE